MEELFLKALEAAQQGQSYAFATIIESTLKGTPRKTGAKMVVLADGSFFGSIGGGRNERNAQLECLKAIKTHKPTVVTYQFDQKPGNSICGGEIKVFIEPFAGKRHLIICGAGHIALPLSALGKMLNYRVIVIDNRPEFATLKRFPHVDTVLLGKAHAEELKKLKIEKNTSIIIVTQGYEHDLACLKTALKTKANYIGFISSKVKKVKFIRMLRDLKISEKQIQRIHAPMGLDIGAETPEEIAISIISELIAIQSGSIHGSLKFNYEYPPKMLKTKKSIGGRQK